MIKSRSILVFFTFVVVMLGISVQACRSDSEIDQYFYSIDSTLTTEQKDRLFQCDSFECLDSVLLRAKNKEFRWILELKYPTVFKTTFDSLHINRDRYEIMFLAYIRDAKGYNEPIEAVIKIWERYQHKLEEEYKRYEEEKERERDALVQSNYDYTAIGDTICLVFHIDSIKGDSCMNSVSISKRIEVEKSIKVSYVVKDKYKQLLETYNGQEEDSYWLKLKVIKSSLRGCKWSKETIKAGQEIKFWLDCYPHVIEQCKW